MLGARHQANWAAASLACPLLKGPALLLTALEVTLMVLSSM